MAEIHGQGVFEPKIHVFCAIFLVEFWVLPSKPKLVFQTKLAALGVTICIWKNSDTFEIIQNIGNHLENPDSLESIRKIGSHLENPDSFEIIWKIGSHLENSDSFEIIRKIGNHLEKSGQF